MIGIYQRLRRWWNTVPQIMKSWNFEDGRWSGCHGRNRTFQSERRNFRHWLTFWRRVIQTSVTVYHWVVNGRFVVRFVVYEGQYPKYENDLKSNILKGELWVIYAARYVNRIRSIARICYEWPNLEEEKNTTVRRIDLCKLPKSEHCSDFLSFSEPNGSDFASFLDCS